MLAQENISILKELYELDKQLDLISVSLNDGKVFDDYKSDTLYDTKDLESLYSHAMINTLTLKAFFEHENKPECALKVKDRISMLHHFIQLYFKTQERIESLMFDELNMDTSSLKMTLDDLKFFAKKESTPFRFSQHYRHLAYDDKNKALVHHVPTDNGFMLNVVKQIMLECQYKTLDYILLLNPANQIFINKQLNEKINFQEAKLDVGMYLYKECIDFDDIEIKPVIGLKVVSHEK